MAGLQKRNIRTGMTLVELLLALGLITVVSTLMFSFYDVTMKSREQGIRTIKDAQLCRSIAMKIAEEIRAANPFVKELGPGITGDDRMLTIQMVTLPDRELNLKRSIKEQTPPAQCDIRQVQYYLAYDEEEEQHEYPNGITGAAPLGLVRREVRTLYQSSVIENQPRTVLLERLAEEIKYIRFRYFDGVEWTDRWDIGTEVEGQLGNSLPQAVEVTVGYAELPRKEDEQKEELLLQESELLPSVPEPYDRRTYTMVVRLSQADPFLASRMMRAQRWSRLSGSSEGSGE